MFVFNRSAAAVLVPIALLIAVVAWSGGSAAPVADSARAETASGASTVAQAAKPQDQDS